MHEAYVKGIQNLVQYVYLCLYEIAKQLQQILMDRAHASEVQ